MAWLPSKLFEASIKDFYVFLRHYCGRPFFTVHLHPLGTFIAIQMTCAVLKRILRDSENMNFEKSVEIRHPSIAIRVVCKKRIANFIFRQKMANFPVAF